MSSTVDAKKLQADESTNKKTDNSICTTVHRVGIKLKNIVMNNMDVFVTRYITK